MNHTQLKDDLMGALYSAPKPLTRDVALSIASDYLTKNNKFQELSQFQSWFDDNGDMLLEKINNG